MKSLPSLGQKLNRALREAKQRFPMYYWKIFKLWEKQIREAHSSLTKENHNDVP